MIKQYLSFLSNFTLTKQLLIINLLIALISLFVLVVINFYLIKNDNTIQVRIKETEENLEKINIYLENNSIARIPLFNDCRIDNLIDKSCKIDNSYDDLQFSNLELEPTIAQQFIIQNFLDSEVKISIYNNNMIEIINSSTIFVGSSNITEITESDLSDKSESNYNIFQSFKRNYSLLFNYIYSKIIRQQILMNIVQKKHNIQIFKETNKKRRTINQTFLDRENNIIYTVSAPIISNNIIYGVTIISHTIEERNDDLSFLSFILFNFYLLFILVTIILSLFFIRGLITPIKQLSILASLEIEKLRRSKNLKYPKRKDEIGLLSNQIQSMSKDLKLQMNELEKFTADVAHELKNPLTAIKTSTELLLNKNLDENIKIKLLKNFNTDVDRMNKLISEISNFSRIIAEIETENFQLIEINDFLSNFKKNYLGNTKNIKIEIKLEEIKSYFLANQEKLLQVFLNLIDNSISLSKENTSILIQTNSNNLFLKIKIYDQGKGINYDHKYKIFNRFYTDRDDDRDKHSGLGLSICKEIIKSFNGSIELTKSDKFDFSGACFIIKLPLRKSKFN